MDTSERFLFMADLALSFLWMCFSAIPSYILLRSKEKSLLEREIAIILFCLIYLLLVFVFNWLGSLTNGAYNPVDILSAAIDGSPVTFVRTIAGRIFAEAVGFIVGAELMEHLAPQLLDTSCTNMDVTSGGIKEGIISFTYVVFFLWSKKKYANNFFLRVLIMGICEVSLVLFSGGCMNPAYAFGWAFHRGDHIKREHIYIYWLAPLEATLLGFWVSSLLADEVPRTRRGENKMKKSN